MSGAKATLSKVVPVAVSIALKGKGARPLRDRNTISRLAAMASRKVANGKAVLKAKTRKCARHRPAVT